MVQESHLDEENRIMRVWTPLILRSILIAAMSVLAIGLAALAIRVPGYYVQRFHQVQSGSPLDAQESLSQLIHDGLHGNPHDIMTIGLILLTLVPLVRVAFTFVLFVKEGDHIFTAATAYVLVALSIGILLGRVG